MEISAPYLRDRLTLARGMYPYRRYMLKNKCIFIHIPKTAGTSILHTLNNAQTTGRTHEPWPSYWNHSPTLFHKYFKFSFVRNPITRYISAYNYLAQGGNGMANDTHFRDLIKKYHFCPSSFAAWLVKDSNIFTHKLFWPQWYFICDHTHKVMVDSVYRFENIQDEYQKLSRTLGKKLTLVETNMSTILHPPELTDEAQKIIIHLYKHDFDTFGYPHETTSV